MTNEQMLGLAKSVGAIVVESGVCFVGYEQLDKYTQAATLQANQWRPIADAPWDGTEILVLGTRHEMLLPNPQRMVAAYRRGWWSGGDVVSHLTGWLPLPPTGTEQS